jgi:hypothetical protein
LTEYPVIIPLKPVIDKIRDAAMDKANNRETYRKLCR